MDGVNRGTEGTKKRSNRPEDRMVEMTQRDQQIEIKTSGEPQRPVKQKIYHQCHLSPRRKGEKRQSWKSDQRNNS